MKPPPYAQRVHQPLLAKTFPNVLAQWLAEEFPHLGGPKVRSLFVTEVLRLMDAYLTPAQRLQPGQVVWYAVDKTDLPRAKHSMAETRLLPVILTLVTRSDIQLLARGTSRLQVRQEIVARLLREAVAQGAVLAEIDLALLFSVNPSTVGSAIRAYERAHQCILPRRGTLHDLGPSVTHKGLIAKKAFLEAKQAPQVARETNHSLKSTERYLVDLMRVYISLQRRDLTVAETAFTTNLSISLVKEYAALIAELGLTDAELPSTMAALVRAAQTQPADSPDSPVPALETAAVTC